MERDLVHFTSAGNGFEEATRSGAFVKHSGSLDRLSGDS
jgi:hypothetical protein